MNSKMFDSDRISAIVDARLGAALWFSYPITGGLVRRHDLRKAAENQT